MTTNTDNSDEKTATKTTSRKRTAKTTTQPTSYLTASGIRLELRCSEEFVAEIDAVIEDLYARYNGYEIAEAFKRYRKRNP